MCNFLLNQINLHTLIILNKEGIKKYLNNLYSVDEFKEKINNMSDLDFDYTTNFNIYYLGEKFLYFVPNLDPTFITFIIDLNIKDIYISNSDFNHEINTIKHLNIQNK